MVRNTLLLGTRINNGRDTALLRERIIIARDTIDGKLLLRERINR
jgi:hypothetical protein